MKISILDKIKKEIGYHVNITFMYGDGDDYEYVDVVIGDYHVADLLRFLERFITHDIEDEEVQKISKKHGFEWPYKYDAGVHPDFYNYDITYHDGCGSEYKVSVEGK